MRLLYVCSDFGIPPDGTKGASIHLRSITAALAACGHDLRLLSPLAHRAEGLAVPVLAPPGLSRVREGAKDLADGLERRGYNPAVTREFRALSYGTLAAGAALKAMGSWRPEAIIERLSLLGHVGLDLARSCGVPLILEVNALLTEEAAAYRRLELRELAGAMERRVLEQADAIVAVSSPLAQLISQRCPDRDRIHVVANGVDLACFEEVPGQDTCRTELGLEREDVVIGFCGSLKPWHGVDLLVEAFDRFLRAGGRGRLLIVGSGPQESSLKTLVAARGLDACVTFTGAVAHERVPRCLRAMDVAVAPFRAAENFYFSPIKLFEYMAAGTCVVAARLGQIAEVIDHGRNGLLCAPDDPDALCAALQAACADAHGRKRLAVAARRDVRQRHTWRHAAQAVEQVIRSCRHGGRAGRAELLVRSHEPDATIEPRPPSLVARDSSLD